MPSRSNAGSNPHASNQETYTLLTQIRSRFGEMRVVGFVIVTEHCTDGTAGSFQRFGYACSFRHIQKAGSHSFYRDPEDLLENYEKPLLHQENP